MAISFPETVKTGSAYRMFVFWKRVFAVFMTARPGRLAAALSYYAIFSIVPLLVIMFSVFSLFIDPDFITNEVFTRISVYLGSEGATFLRDVMLQLRMSNIENMFALGIGIGALMFASLGAFSELQDGLSSIWEYTREKRGVKGFFLQKAVSLVTVIVIGALFLAVFIGSTAISLFDAALSDSKTTTFFIAFFNQLLSAAFITALFAVVFRTLPWAHVSWRSACVGGLVSAMLFVLGKSALAFYISASTTISVYGQAGALIALLVWVYYSGFILYFGAAIARVVGEMREERLLERA